MGKRKRTDGAQAEIWDDSALIESWDAAYNEYKKYHSIAARGESVEDILKQAETEENEGVQEQHEAVHDDSVINTQDEENVDGGSEHEYRTSMKDEKPVSSHRRNTSSISSFSEHDAATTENAATVNAGPPEPAVPPMLAKIQDEALKSVMMSWFFAGYYTGYYEGVQRAAKEHDAKGINSKGDDKS